jgi:hypothetical protein
MAYNYLGLVNDVAARYNETALNSGNFAAAAGFYSAIKEAVNASLRHINQAHYQWPFNHQLEELVLEAGVSRYTAPPNAKLIDFESFRVKRDTTLNVNEGKLLTELSYSEYLSTYLDQEYETDTTKGGVPRNVARSKDGDFIIIPMPDQAYEIEYEYFTYPVDLVSATDIPVVPERFRHVVIDGTMYYAYMFRDNVEQAQLSQAKFESGLKQMRSLLINEHAYFRAV